MAAGLHQKLDVTSEEKYLTGNPRVGGTEFVITSRTETGHCGHDETTIKHH